MFFLKKKKKKRLKDPDQQVVRKDGHHYKSLGHLILPPDFLRRNAGYEMVLQPFLSLQSPRQTFSNSIYVHPSSLIQNQGLVRDEMDK